MNFSLANAQDQVINSIPLRKYRPPYLNCPTDPNSADLPSDAVQANYGGNLGNTPADSANTACQPWKVFEDTAAAGHGGGLSASNVSGIFSRAGFGAKIRDLTDGTSNVFLAGEILPECNDHTGGGWAHYNNLSNAHSQTLVPPNNFTTCPKIPGGDKATCAAQNNWNYSWGFRSRHTGGLHMLMGDGTVRFISENINAPTWRNLGAKADGNTIGDF